VGKCRAGEGCDGVHGLVHQVGERLLVPRRCPFRLGGVEALLQAVDAVEPPTRLILASAGYDMVLAIHEQRMATWRSWEKVGRSADPA
jgi:hypothetical protein